MGGAAGGRDRRPREVSAWIGEGTGAKLPIRNRRREDMWRHTPILVALGLAGLGAALPADQVVVYRELVKGEPQGLGRFFEVPERLFVRGTFDLPLPDPVIGLELVRNTTSILNKPFDLKGDTTKFDLRLTPPDGRPFQPGVYTFHHPGRPGACPHDLPGGLQAAAARAEGLLGASPPRGRRSVCPTRRPRRHQVPASATGAYPPRRPPPER